MMTKTTAKKVKTLDLRTEEVEGVQYLILQQEGDIHQIDLMAISSWGLLLGLTDTVEIVTAILRYKDKPVKKGEPNLWTPLYEALGAGLDQMSRSGVPAEFMEEVLVSDAPLPDAATVEKLAAARAAANAEIALDPEVWGDVSAELAVALEPHAGKIAEMRVEFVDTLAPTYELPPPIPPQSVPEAMDVVNRITPPVNSLMTATPTA